jgi:hypothetical protein
MPNIVEYSIVLDRLIKEGYRSLYFNSGAFGFGNGVKTESRGWIGPHDGSIRESARSIVRQTGSPYDVVLSKALIKTWQTKLPGAVWAMPKSHWAYELEFGHRDWLPDVLNQIGVDAKLLAPLNNAAAIEFKPGEEKAFDFFVRELLQRLFSSDFQLVFPGHSTICTIHTRCQLWWTTTKPAVIETLDALLPADGNSST